MAIKRYLANADTTITNAFQMDLQTRGTGANMGVSDTLEVFSIYGQDSGSSGLSQELSRVLIKFPTDVISTDRTNKNIPKSGSVSFYLKMFNAEHAETLARKYYVSVAALTTDWEEGHGMDMEEYKDLTNDGPGTNWSKATEAASWTRIGGDFADENDDSSFFTQYIGAGNEDLEVDITPLVEQWVNSGGNVLGSKSNYGVMIKLSGSYEAYHTSSQGYDGSAIIYNPTGSQKSYYTKKFFARGSEFFFKRPVIEARWNSATKDNRANFYYSSSLAPAADNLNTLYLYNYVRGQLRNIPSLEKAGGVVYVSLYSGSNPNDKSPTTSHLNMSLGGGVITDGDIFATGGLESTGIYTCSVCITASSNEKLSKFFDVWHMPRSGAIEYHTGTIDPISIEASNVNPSTRFVSKVTNLRPTYYRDEIGRYRLYVREKNWNPNIYTKAISTPDSYIVESASYQIYRASDNYEIIPYGTASTTTTGRGDLWTQLSYDVSGNYFDLDIDLLEAGYAYGIRLAYYNGAIGSWVEQPEIFKFRVEE